MSESISLALVGVLYRTGTIVVGLLFGVMGYRLFIKGVFERAGDLKAAWGDRHLTVKQAAPGTFFALFGTVVIAVSLWKGVDIGQSGLAAHYVGPSPLVVDSREFAPSFASATADERRVLEKASQAEPLAEGERSILALWLSTRLAQPGKSHFIVEHVPVPSGLNNPLEEVRPDEQLG